MERRERREDGLMHELRVDRELCAHRLDGLRFRAVKRAACAQQRDDGGLEGCGARRRG